MDLDNILSKMCDHTELLPELDTLKLLIIFISTFFFQFTC